MPSRPTTIAVLLAPLLASSCAPKTPAPARETLVSLEIGGMSCGACEGDIEIALRNSPGVIAADIDLASRTGVVRCREGVSDEQIAAAVRAAGVGYLGLIVGRAPAPSTKPERR